jgi:hypothetical protein
MENLDKELEEQIERTILFCLIAYALTAVIREMD